MQRARSLSFIDMSGAFRRYLATIVLLLGGMTFGLAQVAAPTFSPPSGEAHSKFSVTVSCSTSGSTVYFTLDGSEPSDAGLPIPGDGKVLIPYSLTLKAKAYAPGLASSATTTASYNVNGGLAAGASHALLLKTDGTGWAWGLQTSGRLGNGNTGSGTVLSGTDVRKSSASPVVDGWELAAGYSSSYILDADQNVWAFGGNGSGQLGDNGTTASGYAKQVVTSASGNPVTYLTGVSSIAAGYDFALAVEQSSGNVWAWGQQADGRLGNGSTATASQKYAIKVKTNSTTTLPGVSRVAGGEKFGLALALGSNGAPGQVWGWGFNGSGQLGIGNTSTQQYAIKTKLNSGAENVLNDVVEIAAGWDHAVAIRRDASSPPVQTVWCWGQQASGRLGNGSGTTANIMYPVQVQKWTGGYLTDIIRVAAGPGHTLALDSSGKVWSWGANADGQLGSGSNSYRSKANVVKLSSSQDLTDIVEIAAGGDGSANHGYSLALRSDGTLFGWGYNTEGEVGNNSTTAVNYATQSSFATSPTNTAPTISLAATNQQTFQPGSMTLAATVSDAQNNLSRVEFFLGTTLIATKSSAPFTHPISNLTEGSYSYTAKATDALGLSASSSLTFTVEIPSISVTVTADASELPVNGNFRFTRNGPTTSTLTVGFGVAGTASSGTDYTGLGTGITFPVNSATVDLPVTAALDYITEDNETVILTMSSAVPGVYKLGSPSAATLNIVNVSPAPSSWIGVTNGVVPQIKTVDIFGMDLSGITWSAYTQSYFGIQNKGSQKTASGGFTAPCIFEFSSEGSLIRTIRTSSVTDTAFEDPESICWMGGTLFAIADERKREITTVNIGLESWHPRVPKKTANTIHLTASNPISTDFAADLTANNNDGLEGICYNPVEDCFYGILEGEAGHMHVFKISRTGVCDELCNAESVLRPLVGDLSDIAFDAQRQQLLLLSGKSQKFVTMTLTGTVVATNQLFLGSNQTFSIAAQPEGISYVPGKGVVVVGEPEIFTRYNFPEAPSSATSPYISEFMAKNDTGILDETGKVRDWIEIHNPTNAAVNLAGWSLTDDHAVPAKWTFPARTLPAGGYLVIFCSGKDRKPADPLPLHTNFKLSASGGVIELIKPDGTVVRPSTTSYTAQFADVSFGFSTVSETSLGYCRLSTPGAANTSYGTIGEAVSPLSVPTFHRGGVAVNGGIQNGSPITDLGISTSETAATIYYTTDGSEPYPENSAATVLASAQSIPSISSTTTVRAAICKEGFKPSDSVTRTFIFLGDLANQTNPTPPRPTDGVVFPNYTIASPPANLDFEMYSTIGAMNSIATLPIVSVVSDDEDLFGQGDGIYANSASDGDAWRRRMSVEWIKPAEYGASAAYVQSNVGVNVTGHSSRCQNVTPKHNFRLVFKDNYGAGKFTAPSLFAGNTSASFDQLELRNPTADSFASIYSDWATAPGATYITDTWVNATMGTLGHPSFSRRFAHCYLNGKYWGVYELMEHVDDHFADAHPVALGGLPGDDFDVLGASDDSNGGLISGNLNAWNSLKSNAASLYSPLTGLTSETHYQAIEAGADLTNLIDYMLLNWWANNTDWPSHNYLMVCAKDQDGTPRKFKFLSWDAELALRKDSSTVYANIWSYWRYSVVDGPAYLFRKLRYHEGFRSAVRSRLDYLTNGTGALSAATSAASYQAMADTFSPFVDAELGRWGDSFVTTPPTSLSSTEWSANITYRKNSIFPQRVSAFRDMVEADLRSVEREIERNQDPTGGFSGEYGEGNVTGPNIADEGAVEDSDHDGIPDAWEIANGLNPSVSTDAALDGDSDGLTNLIEYLSGNNPTTYTSQLPGLEWIFAIFTPHGVGG